METGPETDGASASSKQESVLGVTSAELHRKWSSLEAPTLILAGVGGLVLALYALWFNVATQQAFGDSLVYWLTGQPGFKPYSIAPGSPEAFLYSPAFIQVIKPLTWLPWPIFATLWSAACIAAYLWLLRPLGWAWTVVLALWCVPEVVRGNVISFLAVATVLGVTGTGAAWAGPLLTKPVLGIGMVWNVMLREWRVVAYAAGTTSTILLISYVLDPALWAAWIDFLTQSADRDETAIIPRVALAALIIAGGAVVRRPWVVPIALLIATPIIGGTPVMAILAALPRLVIYGRMLRSPQLNSPWQGQA